MGRKILPRKRDHLALPISAEVIEIEKSSDNIFADLGLPDAETLVLKAQIVTEIYRLTNERKLKQAEAGKLMGISQPEVSRMFRGNFRVFGGGSYRVSDGVRSRY